jgi:signal transduction histidine kinase
VPAAPPRQNLTAVRTRSLRARVQTSIVTVTAVAVVLFAVPAAIAARSMYHGEAITALQRDATRVAAVVPDTITSTGDTVHVPAGLPADHTVGVYTTAGHLIREHGPARSALAAAADDGRVHVGIEGPDLAVSVPVPADHGVAATVRVSITYDQVTGRTTWAWLLMALLGVCVVGVAALLARRQARQVAIPLERLTASARALGDGDFTIQPERSRVAEADSLAAALASTAHRLGGLVDRERAFSTQVSHQLRTPLTALLLGLESALARPNADLRQAAETALRRGEQLQATIEDLLRLARDTRGQRDVLDVPAVLGTIDDHWRAVFAERGRTLRVTSAPDLPETRASATAVRHVLDVLVGNALVHGAGETTLTAEAFAEGLLVEVADEGAGLADVGAAFAPRPGAGTHGVGLALARSLAEAEGGRLLLRHAAPRPVFSLLLPAEDDRAG